MGLKTSVIIPTYNRSEALIKCLTSIASQTKHPDEIIVAIDGSTDDTEEVLRQFMSSSTLNIHIVLSKNVGRSRIRNLAVQHAKHDLLIFVDDDIRLNPHAIQNHIKLHVTKEKALLNGPYLYEASLMKSTFQKFRKRTEENWLKQGVSIQDKCHINGGNFSILKNNFEGVGGFDSSLTDKEDFKLAYDFVHQFNGEIYSSYDAWGYHDDLKNYSEYVKRQFESNKQALKMLINNPEIEGEYGNAYKYQFSDQKKSFYRCFKGKFSKVLDSSLMSLLPISLQDKVFKFFLTANHPSLD